MSDTAGANAAATLSLEINTASALANLKALNAEYMSLHANMSKKLDTNIGKEIGQSVKGLQSSLVAVSSGILSINKALDDIVAAGGKAFGSIAKEAKGLSTKLASGGGSIAGTFVLDENQVKKFNERLKAIGYESVKALESGFTTSSFSKANQVITAFSKNTEVELNKVIRMSQEAKRMLEVYGVETATNVYGKDFVSGRYEADAKARLAKLRAVNDEAAAAAALLDSERKFDKEVTALYKQRAELQQRIDVEEAKARVKARADLHKQLVAEELKYEKELTALRAKEAAARRAEEAKYEAAIIAERTRVSSPAMNRIVDQANLENARRNVNSRSIAYAADYAAELKASENLEALKKKARDQLRIDSEGAARDALAAAARETEELRKQRELRRLNESGAEAAALAKNLAIQERITRELKEQAQWAALSEKQKAAATLKAARVLYSGGADAQAQLPGIAGGTPALRAAQAAGSVLGAETAYNSLANSHKNLSASTNQSAASQVHWNKVANEGHTIVRGLAGSLGTLWITYGSLAPLLAGAALGAAFKSAAVAGSEFQYQLTFVKALGGESAEAVDKLSESAKRLGSEGLRGPVEIASGYRILAQAGLTAAQAIEAMPNTLNLATVGEMEMEQAAVTLTGVMNAFNLSVADTEHVGDVFAKAAALSQTSVQGMTEAMKTASVVGEQYGASMEDTATALTLLAKVNITGTSAGTAFRNMLKELYAPVPQAAKAIEKLGLKIQDAKGNLLPFADIIYDLKSKLEDFSKGDQTQILQRLFGERGGKEAVAMLSLTRKEWEGLRDSIKNSKGFMDSVANELEDTAKGKWAQAINTLKSQLVSAFQEMEPVFSNLADSLKSLFSDPNFVSSIRSIVSGTATLAATLVQMAPVLLDLAKAWLVYKAAMIGSAVWNATTTAVVAFTASMQAAGGVLGPALGTIGTMRGVIAGLPSLLMAIPSPLAIIAGGLAAGVTAWMLWGETATRAGDKAYDSARKAEKALAGAQRRERYGVGDLAEAQEELDKAEKLLELRNQGRQSGTALSDARQSVEKWSQVVASLEKEKYNAQNASYGLKTAVEGKPAKRNASEILGEDPKTKTVAKPNKDLRKTLDENLSSAIKQEQIQLAEELVDIEIELAGQTINSVIATEKKNAAIKASLEIERLLIEASLEDAIVAKDALQITKFQNDLDENSAKLKKQEKATILDVTKAPIADKVAIEDMGVVTYRYIDDLRFEREALELTENQVASLRVERERLREQENLSIKVARNQITPDQAAAEAEAINARAEAKRADEEFQQSYVAGWKKAYKAYADAATSETKRAADTFTTLTNAMESALDQFLTTGKLNFAEFAKSVIFELTKIQAKALIAKAAGAVGGGGGLAGIVGNILGMLGGGSFGTSGTTNSFMTNGVALRSAKGNVFDMKGNLVNTFATGGIVDRPTLFAFAKGGMPSKGLMGEAGPEAILPVARDSAGRLGVRSTGVGGDNISVTINLPPGATAPDIRRATGDLARELTAAVGRSRRYA